MPKGRATHEGGDKPRLAVLLSGAGRTFENLDDRCRDGRLDAEVALVVASRECGGVAKARDRGVPCVIASRQSFDDTQAFSDVVFAPVREHGTDLVCLAGFLSLLAIPDDFAHRVLNVHPSLLPAFGGQGMYGDRVHQAVLDRGVKVTGCTVHLADARYDRGPILVQQTCPVFDDDTVEALGGRVFALEREAYPYAVAAMLEGRATVGDGRVNLRPGPDPIAEARRWCLRHHDGEKRNGGEPYSAHPIAVADLLRDAGVVDLDVRCAALLHDLVEDCDVTLDDLAEHFGRRVAGLVDELTLRPEEETDFATKSASLIRKAKTMSPDAKRIKLADRLHNLSRLYRRAPEKHMRYAKSSIELLHALKPWPAGGEAIAARAMNLARLWAA